MDKTMVEQEIILRRKLDLLLRTGKILVESAADTNRIVRNESCGGLFGIT